MIHFLESRQKIPAPLHRVWEFFTDPRNLAQITPADLDFQVLSTVPERIHPGLMISYQVRPLFGIPVRWLTEITHVEPGARFVDEQRVGPYRIWHHEHHFQSLPDGSVEMMDRVTYVLPFGWLGNLAHPFLVKPTLEKIFEFRRESVERIFKDTLVA